STRDSRACAARRRPGTRPVPLRRARTRAEAAGRSERPLDCDSCGRRAHDGGRGRVHLGRVLAGGGQGRAARGWRSRLRGWPRGPEPAAGGHRSRARDGRHRRVLRLARRRDPRARFRQRVEPPRRRSRPTGRTMTLSARAHAVVRVLSAMAAVPLLLTAAVPRPEARTAIGAAVVLAAGGGALLFAVLAGRRRPVLACLRAGAHSVPALVPLVAIGAASEESVWRLGMLQGLRGAVGLPVAFLGSSLLFAFAHGARTPR